MKFKWIVGFVVLLSLVFIVHVYASYTPFVYIQRQVCVQEPVNEVVKVCHKEIAHANKSVQKPFCETVVRHKGFKQICFQDKNIGIRVDGGRELKADYFNIHKDTVCKWQYPVGDRNFNEFPCCTEIEKKKETCEVIPLWHVKLGLR